MAGENCTDFTESTAKSATKFLCPPSAKILLRLLQGRLGAENLFGFFSKCYERTSVIVTSNLPFSAWPEVFGDERLTGALLDRLTHRVHVIEAAGESYRLQNSKKEAI